MTDDPIQNDNSIATLQVKVICPKEVKDQTMEISIDPPVEDPQNPTMAQACVMHMATELKEYLEHLSRLQNVKAE